MAPQLGPQLSMRKATERYFLFENDFECIFKSILSFKSFKNMIFAIFRPMRALQSTLGPPNRAPIFMKMLPSKNSHID